MYGKKLGIVIFGKLKERDGFWEEWLDRAKELVGMIGYEPTHCGLGAASFPEQLRTLRRSEQKIRAVMAGGEPVSGLDIYSLPADYRTACDNHCWLELHKAKWQRPGAEKYASYGYCEIKYEDAGEELVEKIKSVLLDFVEMEQCEIFTMDDGLMINYLLNKGYDKAEDISRHYPTLKILSQTYRIPPLHLYVGFSDPEKEGSREHCFPTIAEALNAADRLAPVPEEIAAELEAGKRYPSPKYRVQPVVLHIAEGVYREKLVVSRPNVTFLGESRERTVLVFGHGANEIEEDGEKRGTFRTATLRVNAPDFTAKHITFQNDAGFGHTVGQAIALYVDGDRCFFEDCGLLASQDTLFDAPLPLDPVKPNGKGPGEHKPRIRGRHMFYRCFLQGDVDFIFGSGTAWFEECTVFSKLPGDRLPPESPDTEAIYGYVTAASTHPDFPYGYVFHRCRLTGDCPRGSVYLGRPWKEFAKTVFLECELGEHIHPLGWHDWGKTHGNFYYGEYASTGPGASPETRADFSRQLTDEEAQEYTVDKVLEGWNPLAAGASSLTPD